MKKTTTYRKLKITDDVYVFAVNSGVSIEPLDIINEGKVLGIRIGMIPTKDVFGNFLGRAGRTGNSLKPIIVEPSAVVTHALVAAVKRTRNWLEAQAKLPGEKLPHISVMKYNGETIQHDDSISRYFINHKCYCANCTEPIACTQTFRINSAGKVEKIESPVPIDSTVIKSPGNKKFLHAACAAVSIEIPEGCTPSDASVLREANAKMAKELHDIKTIPDEQVMKNMILGILLDVDEYTSDFARGAAFMYIKMRDNQ